MALVDVLEHLPADHAQRERITEILLRFAAAAARVQDKRTGLWHDIPDLPSRAGNYPEASASCMLAYTFAKGVRLGVLPTTYLAKARHAWDGILKEFVIADASGNVDLKGTVAVSGLGGKPYRDGSFEYYMSEPVVMNDPKGIGAFILCAAELEWHDAPKPGKGKTVMLDRYFNNEWKKDATGAMIRWHYTWEDRANPGYALLGEIFRRHGAQTSSLDTAPDAVSLGQASIYVIVDPDTEKESPKPNYIDDVSAEAIEKWVRGGGVLVLLGNDTGNAEFSHVNALAARFGIQFNLDSRNRVQADRFPEGAVFVTEGHPIFGKGGKLYIKEYSSLSVRPPAKSVLDHNGTIVMAVSQLGRGTVFALGDPWIYNEYLDGRKLPSDFGNHKAAESWTRWLLEKAK
jgi:unsaturated rhamnogalacturonyl hydrolase